jgi:sigma-E factor negative regulatory protein RseB
MTSPPGLALRWRRRLLRPAAVIAFASLAIAPRAFAEDAAAWLARAAAAAKDLNYVGTIVFQHGVRVETSRLVHMSERGNELEKLVSLDGPAREVIRSRGEVRCYYPERKLLRIEPRAFRNAFPSVSEAEQKALTEFYDFRKAEQGRVAGFEAQAFVFEPKDGLRYGHKFWVDTATGMLLKARTFNERGEIVEQLSFTDLSIGAKITRDMVQPTWSATSPDWKMEKTQVGEIEPHETGWTVNRLPPGFTKIVEGYRPQRERRDPLVQLVYSDGLVSVSVFIERLGSVTMRTLGHSQQGAINVYTRPVEDRIVTVMGEVPPATVRQMAVSLSRR